MVKKRPFSQRSPPAGYYLCDFHDHFKSICVIASKSERLCGMLEHMLEYDGKDYPLVCDVSCESVLGNKVDIRQGVA